MRERERVLVCVSGTDRIAEKGLSSWEIHIESFICDENTLTRALPALHVNHQPASVFGWAQVFVLVFERDSLLSYFQKIKQHELSMRLLLNYICCHSNWAKVAKSSIDYHDYLKIDLFSFNLCITVQRGFFCIVLCPVQFD